jgi:hypothetical protein
MVRRIAVLLCFLGFTATGHANAASPPPLNIIIEIQNYALVKKRTLQTAKQETARLFAQMRIQIEWREGPQALGDLHVPAFSVVMLSTSMAAEKASRDGVPSITLATSSKDTGRAYVFCDRLWAVAKEQELNEGLMLAHVLTHELGHMIANIGHDTLGIMRKYLELKEAGFFGFTPAQKTAIRAALAGAMTTPAPMIALRAVADRAR